MEVLQQPMRKSRLGGVNNQILHTFTHTASVWSHILHESSNVCIQRFALLKKKLIAIVLMSVVSDVLKAGEDLIIVK